MLYNGEMDSIEALLDSWDRQCRIVDSVASLIDDANRHVKPSDDGMTLDRQLALDPETSKPGPRHKNLRGPHYYDPPTTLLQ